MLMQHLKKICCFSFSNRNFRVALKGSTGLPLCQKFTLKFTNAFPVCVHQGAYPGGGSIQTIHSAVPRTMSWICPGRKTDQGRWRPLTIPGPKLPNSDGRISFSDGRGRRRIGQSRRSEKPWAVPGRDERKSASHKEPCLWPLAPPETGRRWRRCSGRELTSTTPT